MNRQHSWMRPALILASLALLACGALLYREQERTLRRDAESALETVGRFKVEQIVQWRERMLDDAAVISQSPFLRHAVTSWLTGRGEDLKTQLLARFRSLTEHYRYSDVLLVDANGRIRLSLNDRTGVLDPITRITLDHAMMAGVPALTDLHLDRGEELPKIESIAPFSEWDAPDPSATAALVLITDAGKFLYPMLQSWPDRSPSAETVLVRRDGDSVLFLNQLRHMKETALKLRIPRDHLDLPANQAVSGIRGIAGGTDYRGVKVLSALSAIPDSPWFMIAKIDEAEALAVWHQRSFLIVVGGVGLLLLIVMAVAIAQERSAKLNFEALYRAEAARVESDARWYATLMSAGDAIITTDNQGRVELLNPVAEALTGWQQHEAEGKPLGEIFRISGEDPSAAVEGPVERVLRDGVVVGLANHTLLTDREGRKFPIADSGAPVRSDAGEIIGVVLAFRDQTTERRAELALAHAHAFAENLIETAPACVLVLDTKGQVIRFNPQLEAITGRNGSEMNGHDWFDACVPKGERAAAREDFRDALAGQSRPTIGPVRRRDGTEAIVEWRARPLEDENGVLIGLLQVGQDITERIRAVESQRHMTDLLDRTGRMAKVGGWEVDLTNNRVHWTDEVYRIHEVSQGTVVDLERAIRFYAPEAQPVLKATIQEAVDQGKPWTLELPLITAKGRRRWVWSVGEAEWQGGKPVRLFGAFSDITERKESEITLRKSVELIRTITDSLASPLAVIDANGEIIQVNAAWRKFGLANGADQATERGVGQNYFVATARAIPDPYARDVLAGLRRVLAGRSDSFSFEYPCHSPGQQRWFLLNAVPLGDGRDGLVLTHFDLTERKQAEIALRESEARARLILETAPTAMLVVDSIGRIEQANRRAERVFGYGDSEMLGLEVEALVPPQLQNSHRKFRRDFVATPDARPMEGRSRELRGRRRDGSEFPAEIGLGPLQLDGKPYTIVSLLDVTARKQAEDMVRELAERMSLATSGAGVGTFDLDPRTGRLIWSEEEHRLHGVDPAAFSGTFDDWISRIHPEDQPRIASEYQNGLAGQDDFTTEFRIVMPTGNIRILKAKGIIYRDQEKQPVRVLGANWDITDYRRAQTALVMQKERAEAANAAKSRFLSNMSHELRTPLNAIIGFGELLVQDEIDAARREQLDILRESAAQLLELINDVLDLSRIEAGAFRLKPVDFDLPHELGRLHRRFEPEAQKNGLTFRVTAPANLPRQLHGDSGALRQVLDNLIDNALKFTSHGSIDVTVEALAEPSDERRVTLAVRVTDTGIGISPENCERIFEMFEQEDNFLTKRFRGVGLGLAISRRLVAMMDGQLSVVSSLGTGSTFSFTASFERLDGVPGSAKPAAEHQFADDTPIVLHQIPVGPTNPNRPKDKDEPTTAESAGKTPLASAAAPVRGAGGL
ncbi:MAG: PAS domain S-box protein [Azospirillum sp.]|nr:PAS domain S-box protein [Azospirillum sp.]